jgi:serpin B
MAVSALSRNTAPDVAPGDAQALADGNRAFAADLYGTLAGDPAFHGKNLFFSPHSISTALAMTYAGARAATASQMASALHFTLPEDKLHPALDALDLALASRSGTADGPAFVLRIVNSMWGAPQTKFEPAFLDTLAVDYGAGVRLTDFSADPEAARSTINAWVDQQTEDRIKELLPGGSLSPATVFVLVNAVYFHAGWLVPFDPGQTQAATFHAAAGDTQVEMMNQSGELAYAEGDGWQAVEIPYAGRQLSMVAVLPTDLGAFEAKLTGAALGSIVAAIQPAEVTLSLPKFKIDGGSFSLKTALQARGMTDAFEDKADFTGISTSGPIAISDVYHQAFVTVDEKGTEATAATAVVGVALSALTKKATVHFDRPFVVLIRDRQTGAVLFLGRLLGV